MRSIGISVQNVAEAPQHMREATKQAFNCNSARFVS